MSLVFEMVLLSPTNYLEVIARLFLHEARVDTNGVTAYTMAMANKFS